MDYIPDHFLYESDVEHFTIPSHIKKVGRYAFLGCRKLTSVTIPDSVTSIGNGAFWGCSSLTDITIPNSVTSIGGAAFYDCNNLTSITIGSGVKRLLASTFAGCISLRKINYNGTMSQWKKIGTKGSKNIRNCKVICSDGNLEWDRIFSEWMEI